MKENRMYKMVCVALAALFLICAWTAAPQCADEKPAAKGPTLYERLGGANAIAVLVAELIDRSYADPVLSANPRIKEAHEKFPKAAYNFQATSMACQAFGGPEKYFGRTHRQAHQHLKITEKEWDRFIQIFKDCLNDFKVPQKEQGEVLAIIEGTKGEVVYNPVVQK